MFPSPSESAQLQQSHLYLQANTFKCLKLPNLGFLLCHCGFDFLEVVDNLCDEMSPIFCVNCIS